MEMLPYVYSNPSSLTQPELGYTVYHHHVVPSLLGVSINTEVVGTYPSLTAAQTAALDALHTALLSYQQSGIRGNVANVIDLVLRGLITGITRDGIELPLSEFEIRSVRVWHESWGPPMGGEEPSLMQNVDWEGKLQTKVKLPWAKPVQMARDHEQVEQPARFSEEIEPHWAQTRIPYFRRRDDAPFRGEDDPPYSVDMRLGRRPSRKRHQPVLQIVTEQPDELGAPSDAQQQSTRVSGATPSAATNDTSDFQTRRQAHDPQVNVISTAQESTSTMEINEVNAEDKKKDNWVVSVREVQPEEDNSSPDTPTPLWSRERSLSKTYNQC